MNPVCEVYSISLNLVNFVFIMSLDFLDLLIGSLDSLLCMLLSGLGIVVTICPVFKVVLSLLELELGSLGVFAERFN